VIPAAIRFIVVQGAASPKYLCLAKNVLSVRTEFWRTTGVSICLLVSKDATARKLVNTKPNAAGEEL
jgi:hypothetical protein